MMRQWLCQADVILQLHPVDPVLIKSGYATLDGPDMVPVSTVRNGKTVYFFPGSSLKGVLRSHFEKIARTLRDGSVCVPYLDKKKPVPVPVVREQENFGCGYRCNDKAPKAEHYRDHCAACRLFGSLRYGGRFSIGDAYPIEGHTPRTVTRNSVGIDRFTGGTVHGLLFDLMALEGGVFETKVRISNFELWQLAGLNFLLTDLADKMISIGSGRSRGLGRVRGEVTSYTLTYLRPVSEVQGLGQLADEKDQKEYGLSAWKPPTAIPLPEATVQGLRRCHDLSADWSARLAPLAGSLEAFLEEHPRPLGT
jgi:CRISPR/Cas system CSM-associated protein Csm3 (group 7 of RAMP superfamily)